MSVESAIRDPQSAKCVAPEVLVINGASHAEAGGLFAN